MYLNRRTRRFDRSHSLLTRKGWYLTNEIKTRRIAFHKRVLF